ncbi:MAG: hypothetical protein A2505_00110 [Deltaproteobacteria bacterium RIFOXYD12_FULL_55_16]|nr:MAG: hypothetical protein A2505_00110 [Deltaproteobacteria bacterium RIFOXYD12_FULL_55_16]
MGQDNQPKHRQKARDLKRRAAQRAPYARLLIVCEGEKTEPHYFKEICHEYRLATPNVQVWPGALGTQPLQVVEYAEHLFREGDNQKNIQPCAFDQVCAVFDRDDHLTYHSALAKAAALNGKLKNDLGKRVPFHAIASVPCFELWLLLHFVDVFAPLHRDEVYARLKQEHLPGYDKGQGGHWAATKHHLNIATQRAQARAAATTAHDGTEPYTGIYQLVSWLTHLKD